MKRLFLVVCLLLITGCSTPKGWIVQIGPGGVIIEDREGKFSKDEIRHMVFPESPCKMKEDGVEDETNI